MKKIILICLSLIAVWFAVDTASNKKSEEKVWKEYGGVLTTDDGDFRVEISETREPGQPFKHIVHLNPLKNNILFPEALSYQSITGHDYDNDGKWDQIFYCGFPNANYGCNSWRLGSGSEKKYEPCPGDEKKPNAFGENEIYDAVSKLDAAMKKFHDKQYVFLNHNYKTGKTWYKN